MSFEKMTTAEIMAILDAESARDMAERGYVKIPLSSSVVIDPLSVEHRIEAFYQTHLAPAVDGASTKLKSVIPSISIPPSIFALVPSFFARFVAPVLDYAYNALKPAMVSNWLMPPDVVTLTIENLLKYHLSLIEDQNAWSTAVNFRRSQTPKSRLVNFWNGVLSDLKPYDPRIPSSVQSIEASTLSALPPSLPLPVPSIDTLAEQQFFNTPQPDYALGAGETLVVQFNPESANTYLWRLDGKATVTTVAKSHHVYRLSDVHLTTQEVAVLKKAAYFTLRVDDHIRARYDPTNEVIHFDTGLFAAFGRALAGGRKVTKDHYVVQPHNGSTQQLLDTIQGYEPPLHAIDLRHHLFVFDGRSCFPPALLNSTDDRTVISPAVYGSGAPVYDIARRVAEARNASQPPVN